MKTINFPFILFLGLISGFLACNACTASGEEIKRDQVIGKWILETATRDGKDISELMESTYFEFTEEGKMNSNLPGFIAGNNSTFKVEGSTLKQLGKNPVDYTIETLNDQQLVMSGKISGHLFKFNFKK